jgi:hypothetical protein
VCTDCAGGRFGAGSNLQSAACSGLCSLGFFCPAGSASATANECPPQSTSLVGSSSLADCNCLAGFSPQGTSCHACSAGRFKSTTSNAACSSENAMCSDLRSSWAVFVVWQDCGAGSYSLSGATVCSPCPSGRYGTGGSPSAACTGACRPEFWCGQASTNGNQNPCPASSNSSAGASSVADCLCVRQGSGYGGFIVFGSCCRCPDTCRAPGRARRAHDTRRNRWLAADRAWRALRIPPPQDRARRFARALPALPASTIGPHALVSVFLEAALFLSKWTCSFPCLCRRH